MAFVITMAGKSSRFTEAGYTIPKYALPIGDKSLFEASVSSFKDYFSSDLFTFIIRPDGFAKEFVQNELSKLNVKNFKIIELKKDTLGQAESLYLGLKDFHEDFPIWVFNIDTIRHNFKKPEIANVCDGYLEVFIGSGSNWSFVDPGKNQSVLKTTEKEPISNLCSNGLYFFRSHKLFQNYFLNNNLSKDLVKGELYIAPLYNKLINDNCDIRYINVDKDLIDFCGTPQEYIELTSQGKKL